MQLSTVLLLLGALGGVNAGHPIEKVIKLLDGLKEKSITEGKAEAVAFTKFQYWCSTSVTTLSGAIADEKETIDELTDQLAGLKKQKASLEEDISTLEEELKNMQASAKEAKDDRADEAKLYNKANKDLESTITAVEGCIKALSGAEKTTESLLSAKKSVKLVLALVSLEVTETQRSVLEGFAEKPKQLAAGDEAAHVDKYDFKSENVIELLKNLKLSFEDGKLAGTKAETNALNAYDLAKKARDNSITAAEKSKKKKETELASTKTSIADATLELKNTNKDLKDDSKTLNDTQDSCRVKTGEWNERSNTRTLEIAAMDKAMEILAESAGVRTKAPGNPVPPPSPASALIQLLNVRDTVNDPKMKAVALLKEVAKDTKSRALERLAVEVAAHLNGPFDAVNNMVEKMIFRLMDEQKQEDEHKLWCDQEIKKTNVMKDDKDDKIADLRAEIKVENGEVAKLKTQITAANKMISDIVTFVKEATEIRGTGKQENKLAIKDATDAQTSLTNAIAVLTAFYKDSGAIDKEPWEFIQKGVKLPKNPATWSKSYTGEGNTGIIAILEGVLSDFSKMEADTKAQEAQDQKAFEDAMKDNSIEKAGRTQEVTMKEAEMARRNDKIVSLSSTKKDTEGELEKTEQYLTDLKPACVNGDSSYDDRKAARAKEIGALKKAQIILQDAFKEKVSFLAIKKHQQ